jgi:hypothetical protein
MLPWNRAMIAANWGLRVVNTTRESFDLFALLGRWIIVSAGAVLPRRTVLGFPRPEAEVKKSQMVVYGYLVHHVDLRLCLEPGLKLLRDSPQVI